MGKNFYIIDGESARYLTLRAVHLHLSLMSFRDLMSYDGVMILRETSSCLSCTHEIVVTGKSVYLRSLRKIRLV